MHTITERPQALKDSFVLMGVLEGNLKQYGCLIDARNGRIFLEELWWTQGVRGNEATANLRTVENDEEWAMVYKFVTEKTTILSPRKLKQAIQLARSRGVRPLLDELIARNFPYANRKINMDKKVTIPLPRE